MYEDFEPYVAFRIHKTIVDDEYLKLARRDAMIIMNREIKEKIPYDFNSFIVWDEKKDEAQMMYTISCTYYPPNRAVVEKILQDARYRAYRSGMERGRSTWPNGETIRWRKYNSEREKEQAT